VTSFGVPAELNGTYEANPDGTGTIEYSATGESGAVSRGQARFRIANADELEFQPRSSATRDWESAATVTPSESDGLARLLIG